MVAVAVPSSAGAAAVREPLIVVEPQQSIGGSYRTTGFFEIEGEPGAAVSGGRLLIKNRASRPVTVSVEPVDGETAQNLGFAYKLRGPEIRGSTRWTELAKRRVTIAAGRTTSVELSVQIPASAKAGEYLSGISVQARGQNQETNPGSGVVVSSERRHVVGLLVSIPGPRYPSIELSGAHVERLPAGVTFFLHARNPGNKVLRKVYGSAEVTRGGKKVLSTRIQPGTFVSGTSIKYPLLARNQRPSEGTRFRVRATLHYRGGVARLDEFVTFGKKQAKRQEEFLGPNEEGGGVPWWVAFGFLAVPLTATLGRRRRRSMLSRSAGLTLLERELAGLEESGRPLSVIALTEVLSENGSRRKLIADLRTRLRSSDGICELSDSELMIISPDTGNETIAGQAADTRRALVRLEGLDEEVPKIGVATAEKETTAEALIERATKSAVR